MAQLQQLVARFQGKIVDLWVDNASWHKGPRVRAFLVPYQRWFHLHYHPPYHPELNPQERIWRRIRYEETTNHYYATPVGVGTITPGVIEISGDVDYFAFTVTSTANYVIYTRGTANTTGYLYNSTYSQITVDYDNGENNNFRIVRNLTPGTYYVAVALGSTFVNPAAYELHIEGPGSYPLAITFPPKSLTVQAGSSATFSVGVVGTPPFNFQWQFKGQNIPGATNITCTVNAVGASQSGDYTVLVWDSSGTVASATAYLSVLTDGANGTQPTQISAPFCPAPSPSVDSLILVTHGWEPKLRLNPLNPWPDISWITNMCNEIRARVPANWDVRPFDWRGVAWFPEPDLVLREGVNVGKLYGRKLKQQTQW